MIANDEIEMPLDNNHQQRYAPLDSDHTDSIIIADRTILEYELLQYWTLISNHPMPQQSANDDKSALW